MAFYANGWAFNGVWDPFVKHMVQRIAAAGPGFKLPNYDALRGELLQSVCAFTIAACKPTMHVCMPCMHGMICTLMHAPSEEAAHSRRPRQQGA